MQGFWTKTTTWKWYYATNEIVYVLFICGNVPAPPAYIVYLSQLIRYFRAGLGLLIPIKSISTGFLAVAIIKCLTVTEYYLFRRPSPFCQCMSVLLITSSNHPVDVFKVFCCCISSIIEFPFQAHILLRMQKNIFDKL